MTSNRWKRISELYHSALGRNPGARAAFLDMACGSDADLRGEVESLLQHELPSTPALDVIAAAVAATPSSRSAIGARLGRYEVKSFIGEGGMGQVYRAHDADLGREVAIKVLHPIFALDATRRARFDREARVLASLNHAHIAAIYGIAEGDGFRGLVLELVEGDSLAERLRAAPSPSNRASPLPMRDALLIAHQLADALQVAHDTGIIHRDLKPANIKIASDGTVKVLDFGLAKVLTDHDHELSASLCPPGPRIGDTGVGAVLGTASYMSPEQAEGRQLDKRTDIWAFGCVLYEMVAGRPAFPGKTLSSTITSVLECDPDWSVLPVTPPRIVTLLHRCLEKDPKRRLQDIGEARVCLEDVIANPLTGPPVRDRSRTVFRLAFTVAIVAVIGSVGWNLRPTPRIASPIIRRLGVPVSPDQRPAALRGLAISAQDRYLAYVFDQGGVFRLCVKDMSNSETKILEGTEGALLPFFSPDGQWIAFFSDGKLNKVPAGGGRVVTLLDLPSLGGAGGIGGAGGGVWGPRDTIYFSAGNAGIWEVSAQGGNATAVTVVERSKGEIAHRYPLLLPDGKTLLYTIWYGPGWDERQIIAQRLGSQEKRVLVIGADTPRYAPTGHLTYTRAGAVMAIRFDASVLDVSGTPVTLLNDLREGTPAADYDVSSHGSMVYVEQSPEGYKRVPVLVSRSGVVQPLPGFSPAYYQNPVFSPDGRRLALMITGSIIDLWVYDFKRATLTRLTTEGSSQYPVWTPDGKRIVYRATRSGLRDLFWKSVDGTTAEEQLTTSEQVQTPWSAARDGMTVAFTEDSNKTGTDIWVVPLAADRKSRPLLREQFNETKPRFSPSGQWLAYVSDRSGRPEIYVQSYPGGASRWQLSTDGGEDPLWARDGRELFYRNGAKVMLVKITEGAKFAAAAPRLLFEGNFVAGEPTIDYDVDPAGGRFLMIQPSHPDPPVTHINIVLNWFEELKQRLPAAP
jgi:serine/threonine protein kinase/Tol biopolymer transport system component